MIVILGAPALLPHLCPPSLTVPLFLSSLRWGGRRGRRTRRRTRRRRTRRWGTRRRRRTTMLSLVATIRRRRGREGKSAKLLRQVHLCQLKSQIRCTFRDSKLWETLLLTEPMTNWQYAACFSECLISHFRLLFGARRGQDGVCPQVLSSPPGSLLDSLATSGSCLALNCVEQVQINHVIFSQSSSSPVDGWLWLLVQVWMSTDVEIKRKNWNIYFRTLQQRQCYIEAKAMQGGWKTSHISQGSRPITEVVVVVGVLA